MTRAGVMVAALRTDVARTVYVRPGTPVSIPEPSWIGRTRTLQIDMASRD